MADATVAQNNLYGRLVELLNELGGIGAGPELLGRLMAPEGSAPTIARALAATPAFTALYKQVTTSNLRLGGPKDADTEFVGLAGMPAGLPFEAQFEQYFRPRLAKRADGFAAIVAALPTPRRGLLLVETGCMRVPGHWTGDGQSTFIFDALARDCNGLLFSIDASLEAIDTARRACSSATQMLLGDSVSTLSALSRTMTGPANLVYLDSFDLNPADPLPSAIHHAMELAAARTLIGPGTVVCVDDYGIGHGGKGMILDAYFAAVRAEVIYSGYQKAWRVP